MKLVCALAAIFALLAIVSIAHGARGYRENPKMARAIVKESRSLKGYEIIEAECRTADLAKAGVAITSDVSECLIVTHDGKGKPLYCGILHIPFATAGPYLLEDVDYSSQAPCKQVKAYLAKQQKKHFTA